VKFINHKFHLIIVMAGVFLLLIMVLFAGYQLHREKIITADVNVACDLHRQACKAQLPDGREISLSISPKPIKPLVVLDLNVSTSKVKVNNLKVDFQGIGVDMGFYRPELVEQGDGQFAGTAKLSVCTLDKMLWQATVIIRNDEETIIAPFRFEVAQR
jgi:hypothetical protein